MKINGTNYRSIWLSDHGVRIFDQRALPWKVEIVELASAQAAARAIKEMWTRGAPLIGAVAAYGLCMAIRDNPSTESMNKAYDMLLDSRPTAVNLQWALDKVWGAAKPYEDEKRKEAAFACAAAICDEDVEINKAIGAHGLELIRDSAKKNPGRPVNILTHCNAGWLATVDYGTALAPIYMAHQEGIPVHVWVDETRPRNQGALLTAYELGQEGVPHTVIADNTGGLLMQRGEVDFCLVGADRVTRNGDVCNKIGTYLKALAAFDNNVPFYVALPYSTYDPFLETGGQIKIEDRADDEVTMIQGQNAQGEMQKVTLTNSKASNPSFDITPARLVTAYLTQSGVFERIDQAFDMVTGMLVNSN